MLSDDSYFTAVNASAHLVGIRWKPSMANTVNATTFHAIVMTENFALETEDAGAMGADAMKAGAVVPASAAYRLTNAFNFKVKLCNFYHTGLSTKT